MILRRNFFSLVLLAPLAKLVAPFRSEPTYQRVGTYKRYIGRMEITPEAMRVMYPRSREFEEALQRHLNDHRRILMDELESMSGISSASGR